MSSKIILLRVLPHHSSGRIFGHECHHRVANAFDPIARNSLFVALIEQWNDLRRQHLVKIFAVHAVLLLHRSWVRIWSDGEAVVAVVAFAPPAVEDAHVEAAVAAGFHAARSRCRSEE